MIPIPWVEFKHCWISLALKLGLGSLGENALNQIGLGFLLIL